MHRFTLSVIASLSLVAGFLAASAGAIAALSSSSSQSKWTLSLNFTSPPHTGTYYLAPLTKNGTTLTAKVKTPSSSCPGKLSGTLSSGKIMATITFPGTPCSADHVTMKGTMKLGKPGTGTTSGTFTANFYCPATCTYSGKRTG